MSPRTHRPMRVNGSQNSERLTSLSFADWADARVAAESAPIPEGYFTAKEWAAKLSIAVSYANKRLTAAVEKGEAVRAVFNRKCSDGRIRPIPHYARTEKA
jgi:hypothetical protein